MPATVRSKEVQSLDAPRPSAARASLRGADRPTPSNDLDAVRLSRLGEAVKAALVRTHGSGQAAALTIKIDQSQVNRQLKIGTFELRALAAAGDASLAALGEELVLAFGAARRTPQQEVADLLKEAAEKLASATQIAMKLETR